MNESPYTAPETAVQMTESHDPGKFSPLKKMRSTELRSLYRKSLSVRALGALSMFYAALLVGFKYYYRDSFAAQDPFQTYVYYTVLGMCLVSVFAMWLRPAWGQTVGYLSCLMYVASFIISFDFVGLVFGVVGFIVLSSSGILFGRARVSHAILKRNYRRRKKEGRYK